MNYLPARLTWLVIVVVSPHCASAYRAERRGGSALEQHAVLLGPNSGWSEAATAGALERRIVGPIWLNGVQVTDLWVGDPGDPPLSTGADILRAMALTVGTGLFVVGLGVTTLVTCSILHICA